MVALYLASQSPRRRELLAQIGVKHTQINVNVTEQQAPLESPVDYVQRLAAEKSEAGWQQLVSQGLPRAPVLGADTIVECEGQVLEKPKDEADGLAMLALLSARVHRVLTAVALTSDRGQEVRLSCTEVTFAAISLQQAKRYWQTGEPIDKAGGYGIQGLGAVFVEHIVGSYSGVVGLPLAQTAQLLDNFDVAYWHGCEQTGLNA